MFFSVYVFRAGRFTLESGEDLRAFISSRLFVRSAKAELHSAGFTGSHPRALIGLADTSSLTKCSSVFMTLSLLIALDLTNFPNAGLGTSRGYTKGEVIVCGRQLKLQALRALTWLRLAEIS